MRYTLLNILALVTLASCTETIYIEKDAEKSPYLNGECKTPIAVGISYNEGSVQTRATRAANGSFASGDKLIAYVRHVTTTGSGAEATINPVSVTGVGPTMATLTVNSSNIAEANNHTANNLTVSPTLYWDDFSNSADASTDLRTEKHYLQSYYGYCYNGAAATSYSLTESTGELSWAILAEQNTGTNLTNSDLLWSSSQDPVAYKHATFNDGVEHGKLEIPYSHAMSKVTIEVNLADGFGNVVATNFPTTSKITLNAQTKCIVLAPTSEGFPKGKVTPSTDAKVGITMKKGTAEAKKCTFEAIIAPTVLTPVADVATASSTDAFATIEGIDGNKYDIFLTDAIMNPTPSTTDAWSSKLAAPDAEFVGPESTGYTPTNGGTTIPGVNYKLVVTISKQEIKVVATIADWTTVNAAAEGEINFTTDVAGATDNTFTTKFDLYSKSAVTTTETYYSNVLNNNRNTVCTRDDTNSKWTYDPTLYWEKEGDNRYFRAVSPQVNDRTITTNSEGSQTVEMTAGEGTDFDFCWGTTQAYTNSQGGEVLEGGIVEPRTSNVGLKFYHKTSKVKIVLQTPPTDADGKVTLKEVDGESAKYAKIQFTNLYTTNTVNLHTGELSNFGSSDTRSEKVFAESTTISEDKRPEAGTYQAGYVATETAPAVDDKAETDDLFMIPQEITDDSRLIITLADGTTYSLQLNACKTIVEEGGTPTEVKKWEEGKSYVYYIHLTKEAVQFIAVIQNWEEHSTGGSASMDWDDVDPDLFEGGLIETRKDGWKN